MPLNDSLNPITIERVAIALAKEYGDSEPFHYWERMAKAAIEAMKDASTRKDDTISDFVKECHANKPLQEALERTDKLFSSEISVVDECREFFERQWQETNGGCDIHSANFWFEEGWYEAKKTTKPVVSNEELIDGILHCKDSSIMGEGSVRKAFEQAGDSPSVLSASPTTEQPVDWVMEEIKKIAAIKPDSHGHLDIARALGTATGIAQGVIEAIQIEGRSTKRESAQPVDWLGAFKIAKDGIEMPFYTTTYNPFIEMSIDCESYAEGWFRKGFEAGFQAGAKMRESVAIDLPLINDAITKLVKSAAELVGGGNWTSPYPEDHDKKAPRWLLRLVDKDDTRRTNIGNDIAQATNWIRNATAKMREAKRNQIEGGIQ